MQTVLDLHKNQGITVVQVTHFMQEAFAGDRVAVRRTAAWCS
jgi:ABC-type proline/glycine betaine transport system ATPase subunit